MPLLLVRSDVSEQRQNIFGRIWHSVQKHEDWKYTNVKRLFDNGLQSISATDSTFNSVGGVEVFWSDDEKLVGTTEIQTKEAHVALNTALFEKVLVVRVKKGTQVSDELVLNQAVEYAGNDFAATRLLIEVEDNASLKCQLHFSGTNASENSLHNHVTEIFVGQNANF